MFVFGVSQSECACLNEREGADRGGRNAGPELHGTKAALLGAGETSEEVTMAVVLSRCTLGGGGQWWWCIGEMVCVVVGGGGCGGVVVAFSWSNVVSKTSY